MLLAVMELEERPWLDITPRSERMIKITAVQWSIGRPGLVFSVHTYQYYNQPKWTAQKPWVPLKIKRP